MNTGETSMWKMYLGDNVWRIQTSCQKVDLKLNRRSTASLVAWSINSDLWIYGIRYAEPNKAIKGLGRLTGLPINYIASEDVYMAETSPILHENK